MNGLNVCINYELNQLLDHVGVVAKQRCQRAPWQHAAAATAAHEGDHNTPPGLTDRGVKTIIVVLNPLSPHNALKHHFISLKTDLISLQLRVLEGKISMKLVYQYMKVFLQFLTRTNSSSSTTSRELRQQFAACSG